MNNMKFIKKIGVLLLSIVMLVGCANGQTEDGKTGKKEKVKFLLDWTPNTNHTGIYVALEKGFYDEQGIDVEILNPPEDSTALLVASGKADFGVSFQDSLAMALEQNDELPVVAVAGIVQHNTSGLISLKEKNIDSFKNLEGKTYATWDDAIEQATIKQVMENEGGDFSKVNLYHSMVTDAISAIQTNVDAVWVFEGWDVIRAKNLGLDYNFLSFKDAEKDLDFYTPIIIANTKFLGEKEDLAKRFLLATKKGYEYAIHNPDESAEILYKYAPEYDLEMLKQSQEFLSQEYVKDAPSWGYIDAQRWNNFYKWLYDEKIITKDLQDKGFTNYYLQ